MLKNTGIAAVFGAGGGILKVKNGTDVLIDTKEGRVIFNVSQTLKEKVQKEIIEERKLSEKYRREITLPAKTKDGVIIKITSNISGEEQSAKSLSNGADGIGLLRTEFMFAGRRIPPGEEEQTALYQNVLDNVKGKPVTIRTLDVGGDKPISYINIPAEENPVLGVRGMRVYRENESLIRMQLRALLKVKPLSSLKIMIPMITFAEEFLYVKNMLNEEKHNLGINERVSLGMMIETPGAALNVRAFCKDADFFSLGTNDLSQYTLAIDRGHLTLSNQADSLHPSVLKLMKIAVDDAKAFNKSISICGALASETYSLPLLVGMGIDELAITISQIPEAKYIIRQLNSEQCGDFLLSAIKENSASEVRRLIKQIFGL
jgi:phosphoenolpyruvate-protein phosphotransferase